MATKSELEARVRELEWALYQISLHCKEAKEAGDKLGYGPASELTTEQNPYYVIGAVGSRVGMIAAEAERAVPSLLLVEA